MNLTNHDHEDPLHQRDLSAPCCCCGAVWKGEADPDRPGALSTVMDHADDCAFLADGDIQTTHL